MKLLTKEISRGLQAQYSKGSDLEQMVVCKIFDPCGRRTWYLMNQDPDDLDYLWGIVKGFELEMGSVLLSELESVRNKLGLGLERDLHFKPVSAKEVWEVLSHGKHI